MKATPSAFLAKACTAFSGFDQVATGTLVDVVLVVKALQEQSATAAILLFDDSNGEVIDVDLRGSTADIMSRLFERARDESAGKRPARRITSNHPSQGPGRPRLGVVAREVTLLPRHWEWLASQSGGASAALRQLVEQARLADHGKTSQRHARECAYRFLSAVAGDFAGFEEATRALFAGSWDRFAEETAEWPEGVRMYAQRLANHTTGP